MSRRPNRGRDDYFDVGLVDTMIALFNSAAGAEVDHSLVFSKGKNGRLRPGLVREAFDISEDDFTAWKYKDWKRAGVRKPIEFTDALIGVLDEAVFDAQHPGGVATDERAKRMSAAREHWRKHNSEDVTDALAGLRRHREELLQARAQQPLRAKATRQRPSDAPEPHEPLSIPTDLSAPPCLDNVSRPKHTRAIDALATNYFGIVVEGRHKYGKRFIVRDYVSRYAGGNRVLWYNLLPDTDFRDVLNRLECVEPGLVAPSGQAVTALVGWLKTNRTVLVLDGVEDSNRPSFAPLLELIASLPGPCHVIVIAAVRTETGNTHEIGALTGDEAILLLSTLKIPHNEADVRAAASAGGLSPYALRQAAARFGSVNARHLAAGINALHAELVRQLSPELQGVMEVLQVVNAEFDLAALGVIVAELGLTQTPALVVRDLERLLLVKPASTETWKLEVSSSDVAPIQLAPERLRETLVRLAYHYRARVADGHWLPRDVTLAEASLLFVACRLLQLADADEQDRERLRKCFASTLERNGAFKQLAVLYEFELGKGASQDGWLAFRYARARFVMGHYVEAVSIIQDTVDRMLREPDERDDDLYLACCRLAAEILVESGKPELAVKLLDGALDAVDAASLGGTNCIQAVSALSWALAKARLPHECIALSDDILDKRFEGLTHPFSRQVSNVRVGVALRDLDQVERSIAAFDSACGFFAAEDARAFAWSAAQLALSLHATGRGDDAARALRAAIETNATSNFFNGDLAATYNLFVDEPGYATLRPALLEELSRIQHLEVERLKLGESLPNSRLVRHLLLDLEIDAAAPFVFDLERYKLFSLSTPRAMASNFNKHLVARLREANIEEILERIFGMKPPQEIFQSFVYNRVITVACKDAPILAKRFIYPHLDALAVQSDSVLFLYARYFEAAGDIETAERLLRGVRRQDVFSYYNIKANCVSHSDPEKALELNDQALGHAYSRERRAQILHNKASIVYNNEMRIMYERARQWCDQAVRLAGKRGIKWPRRLLLKLTLANCADEEIEAAVRAYRDRFRAPNDVLVQIVKEIKIRRIREGALDAVLRLEAL